MGMHGGGEGRLPDEEQVDFEYDEDPSERAGQERKSGDGGGAGRDHRRAVDEERSGRPGSYASERGSTRYRTEEGDSSSSSRHRHSSSHRREGGGRDTHGGGGGSHGTSLRDSPPRKRWRSPSPPGRDSESRRSRYSASDSTHSRHRAPPPSGSSKNDSPPRRNYNRSPSPRRASNRSPSPRRASNRSPSPRRAFNRSPSPRRNFNRSPSPRRNHNRSPSPRRNYNRSPSPRRAFNRSPSPRRASNRSPSPVASRHRHGDVSRPSSRDAEMTRQDGRAMSQDSARGDRSGPAGSPSRLALGGDSSRGEEAAAGSSAARTTGAHAQSRRRELRPDEDGEIQGAERSGGTTPSGGSHPPTRYFVARCNYYDIFAKAKRSLLWRAPEYIVSRIKRANAVAENVLLFFSVHQTAYFQGVAKIDNQRSIERPSGSERLWRVPLTWVHITDVPFYVLPRVPGLIDQDDAVKESFEIPGEHAEKILRLFERPPKNPSFGGANNQFSARDAAESHPSDKPDASQQG